jgi:hypothetical protein
MYMVILFTYRKNFEIIWKGKTRIFKMMDRLCWGKFNLGMWKQIIIKATNLWNALQQDANQNMKETLKNLVNKTPTMYKAIFKTEKWHEKRI